MVAMYSAFAPVVLHYRAVEAKHKFGLKPDTEVRQSLNASSLSELRHEEAPAARTAAWCPLDDRPIMPLCLAVCCTVAAPMSGPSVILTSNRSLGARSAGRRAGGMGRAPRAVLPCRSESHATPARVLRQGEPFRGHYEGPLTGGQRPT